MNVNFILAESLRNEISSNGLENNLIINPINVLQSKYIPTALSFGLVIVLSNFDNNSEHSFEISIKNVSTDNIIYSTGKNILPALPKELVNFTFNLDLKNIDIETAGDYQISFGFDNEIHQHDFEVIDIGNEFY